MMNHTSMNAPNECPTLCVPKRWTKNTTVMTARATGNTGRSGLMPRKPSMAVVTVMAGVITPSASKVLAPMMAMAYIQRRRWRLNRA